MARTKAYALPKPPPVRVRCLGPGQEHFFLSSNKVLHRICDRCRQYQPPAIRVVPDNSPRTSSHKSRAT